MFRKILIFISAGIAWLFIFAIPINKSENIYNLAYEGVVNTKPVMWVVDKVSSYFAMGYGSSREVIKSQQKFAKETHDEIFN